jgi:hypothetical protein
MKHENETSYCAQCDKGYHYTEILGSICNDCLSEADTVIFDIKNNTQSKSVFNYMLKACPDLIEYMKQDIIENLN